jgi:hypothetical protein
MFKDLEDSLGAVKNIMTALILVGVVVLLWKTFGLGTPKFSTSGMYPQNVRMLDGQMSHRTGMLGANEPPVFFATAVDPEELNQAAEAGLEVDEQAPYDPRLNNSGWAKGGINNWVKAEGLRNRKSYMEGSPVATRLDAAAAGGNIELP